MSERPYGEISWGEGAMSKEQEAEFESLEKEITQDLPHMSLTSRDDVAKWIIGMRESEEHQRLELGEKIEVRTRIEKAIDNLIEKGVLVEEDGKLSLAQSEQEESK